MRATKEVKIKFKEDKTKKNLGLVFVFVFIFLACLIWISRPLWHWFFMFTYKTPAFWEPLLLIGIIYVVYTIYSYRKSKKIRKEEELPHKKKKSSTTYTKDSEMAVVAPAIITILIIGWAILGPFQAMYPQCYLAHHLDAKEITELPDMDPSVVRIMPQFVAEKYARDALQYR